MNQRNEILELRFEFALMIIECLQVLEEKRKYIIARQLSQSGRSIGTNVREAKPSESRADFVHKTKNFP